MEASLHSPERWKQIESLFHECLGMSAEARTAFLADHCGSDVQLRKEVEDLLESAAQPMRLLEEPVADAAHALIECSSANRVSPGTKIDHYEIISWLGSGGMGQVYLAQDTRLRRRVAIKILAPALVNDERGLRRFEQEARAASALNHPNILTIFEFGQIHGLYFIASEYVEGPTLREKLNGGQLELTTALDITAQIAKALDAAHSLGIIHRDIKPDNVIVRPDGVVKVLDFGIAKLTELQTADPEARALSISISQAGVVIGSARYMSPEQARGQTVDPRTDLFSLGVVLYEMIAGRAPFDGQTISDVISEILKGSPVRLDKVIPGLPRRLAEIEEKALCKDRELRYQGAKDMLADVQELHDELQFQAKFQNVARKDRPAAPTGKRPSGQHVPLPDPSAEARGAFARQERRVAAVIVLLLAVLGLAYAGFVYRRGHGQGTASQPRSLAILPFRNLRQDPSLDYLGFSLADATITKLGYISSLSVRPSSSVEKYRNQSIDPQKVGQELNVDTLLTGNFIKDGDDLRINAQLVDVRANKILWQDSTDVRYDRLLTVQDRVSQEIVKGLELRLSAAEAQRLKAETPVNAEAYEYYLRGIDLYSSNDFAGAITMLEKSAAIDPHYAPTWAHLGRAYTTNASLQFGGREQYDKAQAAYEKALALNPGLTEVQIYMGNMLTDTGRVEQAVPMLRAALRNSPNNPELHWEIGYAYRFAGLLPESVAECEKARQNDPQVKVNSSALNAYLYLGQYQQFLQSLPAKESAYVVFYRGLGEFYLGRREQARQDFDRAYLLDPSLLPAKIGKAIGDYVEGHRAEGMDLLNQTEDQMEGRGVGDAESMYKVAQAYAVMGDKSSSLHMLRHTIEGGFFCYSCFVSDPMLEPVRNEPEFRRLVGEARERHEEFRARFFPAGTSGEAGR